jgi:HlyD family secretion protein
MEVMMTTPTTPTLAPTPDEVRSNLIAPGKRALKVLVVLGLLGALGALGYFFTKKEDAPITYRTEVVGRGDIVTYALATGTLNPTRSVPVGAEVSGKISQVFVEANDVVKAGDMLARFDPRTLESQSEIAKARLSSSQASVRSAQASWESSIQERERMELLVNRGVIARAELDAALITERRARADLDRTRADSTQSKANVEEVQTQLETAVILSPIDGVVMSRLVEPGQTVASSLQSPELFVLAEDLSRMTLTVWIDEADVSLVAPGQKATFQVAAWPDRSFDATLTKLALSPTTTDNVVTYAAELSVENPRGELRPGMTASATVVTEERADVLRVPNAAFRFTPETEDTKKSSEGASFLMPTRGGRGPRTSQKASSATIGGRGAVHVMRDGEFVQVTLQKGRSDGSFTEVISGELKEGDAVVTGYMPVTTEGRARVTQKAGEAAGKRGTP